MYIHFVINEADDLCLITHKLIIPYSTYSIHIECSDIDVSRDPPGFSETTLTESKDEVNKKIDIIN